MNKTTSTILPGFKWIRRVASMQKKVLCIAEALILLSCSEIVQAATIPTFSISLPPGVSSSIQVAQGSTATISYTVRNNTRSAVVLTMLPIPAVSQIIGAGNCNFPSLQYPGQSCTLTLQINGSQVPATGIYGGPVVCKAKGPNNTPDPNVCSRPSIAEHLKITTVDNSTVVSRNIAFATSYSNTALLPITPNLPAGSIPWKVRPIVSFVWGLLSKAFDAGTNVPADALLNATSCSANNGNAFCALVGQRNNAPFIMQSTNGGSTWLPVTVPSLPAAGQLKGVSCGTDANSMSTCVAIGVDSTSNKPFAIQTTNSGQGQTWSLVTGIDFSFATLNSVNCTVNANAKLCQITGKDSSLGPVIYYYTPLNNWQTQTFNFSSVSPLSMTNSLSCSALASGEIDCVVGLQNNGMGPYLVRVISTDPNYTVIPEVIMDIPGPGITINAVGCTNNAGSIFCIAAGNNNGIPFLLQNSNLTSSGVWTSIPVSVLPGNLNAASCSALNGTVSCATGGYSGASNTPLLFATTNGANWSRPSIQSEPGFGLYNMVSCSVSSGISFCFATGVDSAANAPFSVGYPGLSGGWEIATGLNTIFILAS